MSDPNPNEVEALRSSIPKLIARVKDLVDALPSEYWAHVDAADYEELLTIRANLVAAVEALTDAALGD